ncbi:PilW family protein [Suttonella ornithocola]|uniref:Tfp pilus assembly protein PilW n=1 Tax=Suttonella ornithocola TaxID=279832 RepID=A0A380MPZ0_9GAMM|nr:prepilin-type N-terminal cleavage/methylation domain-containing protein [Suttonella ornithocola]SUO94655.1 Tfp pilus assembly protein PilW [Suttonella ornithocola]
MKKRISKQLGISLLELMVSLAIGLILLLMLATVYVTSINTNKLRDTNAELDETARQVFERLEQDLNLAGYVDVFDTETVTRSVPDIDPVTNTPKVDATGKQIMVDKQFVIPRAAQVAKPSDPVVQNMYGRLMKGSATTPASRPETPIGIVTKNSIPNGLTGTDNTLTVTYQVKPIEDKQKMASLKGADTDSAESGWGLDCLSMSAEKSSSTLDPAFKSSFIRNEYSFNDKTFKCNTKPLVGNNADGDTAINEMRFRYLTTQATTDAKADMYDSQAGLYVDNIMSAADVATTNLGWTGVTGVEVCIVVGGSPLKGKLTQMAEMQKSIPSCARDAKTGDFVSDIARPNANDKRLYRRYVKVLTIPNALYFTP